MNFKSILLSAVLVANVGYNQTKASTQIMNDSVFQYVISQGESAIAVGDAQDMRLVGLIAQINQISGQFGSVQFYYAIAENIPNSVQKYSMGTLMVAAFNSGSCVARIQAPISTDSLANQLKQALG